MEKYGIVIINSVIYNMDKPLSHSDYKDFVEGEINDAEKQMPSLCCARRSRLRQKVHRLKGKLEPPLGGCWSKNKFPPKLSYHAFHNELSRKEQIDFLIEHEFFKENCDPYSEEDREDYMNNGVYLCCREWEALQEAIKKL